MPIEDEGDHHFPARDPQEWLFAQIGGPLQAFSESSSKMQKKTVTIMLKVAHHQILSF